MYLKFGYGRGAAQASVDVRVGDLSREDALAWVEEHDGAWPGVYAGVPIEEILKRIDVDREKFIAICNQFLNRDVFAGDVVWGRRPMTQKEVLHVV